MKLSLSVKHIQAGWIDFEVSINGESMLLTASYLDDALGNLAEATLRIVEGERESYAIFAEEPGQYTWHLRRLDEENLAVKILWFDDWNGTSQLEKDGEILLDFEISILSFVRRIIICLSEVLDKYGLDDYVKRWGNNEFPLKDYNKLREVLPELKKL